MMESNQPNQTYLPPVKTFCNDCQYATRVDLDNGYCPRANKYVSWGEDTNCTEFVHWFPTCSG